MKANIIKVALLVLVLALGGFKFYQYKHPEAVQKVVETARQQEAAQTTSSDGTSTSQVIYTNNTSKPQIKPDVPVNGTYKGVVEVGASGFNAFVVNMDANKNWELVYKEFGKSLAYEGFLTTDDVKHTLKDYISTIAEKGVAGRNIHFVVSSGALKNPKTELIMQSIAKMGYVVNKVDATREGQYALKALLPKEYKDNSFTVDIGSGNTKISWYDTGGKLNSIECAGAKYYENNKTDDAVYSEISAALAKVPSNLTQNCFIIGGVPFKLASESRNGEERYTYLKNPDEYSAGDDIKKKSGLNIYRAIYDKGSQNIIFDWDANFTIGFLMNVN